jgi:hypothetical protein
MGAGSDATFPPTCERGRWCKVRPDRPTDKASPPTCILPRQGGGLPADVSRGLPELFAGRVL